MEDLMVFDSWEPIRKARNPKGLAKWGRLSHIAEKLDGKTHKDISFTTAYPGKEGQKKILGSVEGNLHFLMGYGNPGFHMAPYHWQIIDPNLSDEEAEELHRVKGHPSRPELWSEADLEDEAEGDLEDGMPHPAAVEAQEKAKRENEGIRVASGAGVYLAVPSEGLVYGEHNGHVYTWDVVKDSFLAAMNPELEEQMEAAAEERMNKSVRKFGPTVPDFVKYKINEVNSFDPGVYPLVKSLFPQPGSIIPVETNIGETVYGTVSDSSIDFFDRMGNPLNVQVYDRTVKSFDLLRNGDTHPSVLYNFGVSYLGLDKEELEKYAEPHLEILSTPFVVKGFPTEGLDDVPATEEALAAYDKAVVVNNNTVRLVLRPRND